MGKRYRRQNPADLPSKQHLLMELKAIAQELGRAPTTLNWVRLRREDRVCPIGWFYEVFGSFVVAVKLAGLKPRYLQEFDAEQREKMLNDLRELSRELGRPIFGEDVVEARKQKKVPPINHYHLAFKTVPEAIAAAGVAPKLVYTREEMIAILRELDAKLDRPVMETDIDELYRAGMGPAGHTVEKRFGGMTKAREAAGIRNYYQKSSERTAYWQKYTQEELIVQLKALGKKLGRRPTDRDINKASKLGECASAGPFASMFGNLPMAYRAAGFFEIAKNSKRYTDEEIITALKKLTKELGRFPGFNDLEAASLAGKCPAAGTIIRRLGQLRELRSLAGFETPKFAVRYTDEEIIAALKKMTKELGRFPNYRDLAAGSAAGKCPSPSAVRRRGTLSEFRSLAGFEPSKKKFNYTDEEIIAALKRLTDELGRFPTSREISIASKAGKCPGARTIYDRIGTLTEIRFGIICKEL